MKKLLYITILSLITAAITLSPTSSSAQTTNRAPVEKKSTPSTKKGAPHPFHGTLNAVDKTTKTITVGKQTFQISSETKITKNGKPATLDDGVVGQEIGGYVKPTDDGKLTASSVRFGPKTDSKK